LSTESGESLHGLRSKVLSIQGVCADATNVPLLHDALAHEAVGSLTDAFLGRMPDETMELAAAYLDLACCESGQNVAVQRGGDYAQGPPKIHGCSIGEMRTIVGICLPKLGNANFSADQASRGKSRRDLVARPTTGNAGSALGPAFKARASAADA
jgi:hypothetical protein